MTRVSYHHDTCVVTRVQVMLGNVFGLLVSFNYLSNERLAEHQMTFEDEMTCIKVNIFDTDG